MLNHGCGLGEETVAEDERGQQRHEDKEGVKGDSGRDQAEIVPPGFAPSRKRDFFPGAGREIGWAVCLFIDSRVIVPIHLIHPS